MVVRILLAIMAIQVAAALAIWYAAAHYMPLDLALLLALLAVVLLILFLWKLPPFAGSVQRTDNAYVRGQVTVIAPADPLEVRGALRMAMAHNGPVYMRIGKKGEKKIHASTPEMKPGGSITVREGRDFAADFRLSAANPRGSSIEELVLTLPFGDRTDLGAYRIIVGLKPTPEELQYNRRSEGR